MVPQVVDEILAAVMLQGPMATELGWQLQCLVTECIPGPRHCPPHILGLHWAGGHSRQPSTCQLRATASRQSTLMPGARQDMVRAPTPAPAPTSLASHQLHAALRQRVDLAFSCSCPYVLNLNGSSF